MTAGDADTEVVVVGAGPVGLMLAAELRLGGAGVTVLERLAAPVTETRASTLHARTMEIFDQRGLLEPLGTPPNEPRSHFGGLPLELGSAPSPYPGQWKVPQTRVEELLADRARDLGARLLRGFDVRSLTAGPDHVDVVGSDGRRVRAGYAVGCDGERSTVRRLAGIAFPGRSAARELLAADVAGIDVPGRRFERRPAGVATAARRPDGLTRVMVHEFGRLAGTGKPSFAAVAAAWLRVTGEDIGGGRPVWLHAFGDGSRLAERYRAGRVLLAGDAAHQQLPAGGQALNLGLQDAVNLGWKLAAVATGRAPGRLLDTYHDERHEVGRRVLVAVEAQALLLLGGPEVVPARSVLTELIRHPAVRDHLAGTLSGLDVRYGPAGIPAPIGTRLPPGPIDTATGRTTVAALLRSGRGLLLTRSTVDLRVAAVWAGRVEAVELARPLPPAGAALVRPDGHVAWVPGTGTDLRLALRHWFGPPAPPLSPATTRSSDERGVRMPSKVMTTSGPERTGNVQQASGSVKTGPRGQKLR